MHSVSHVDMGEVQLPLTSIPSDGQLLDIWIPMRPVGRMQSVTGEVNIKARFSRPCSVVKENEDDEEDLEGQDAEANAPNELHVTVIRGIKISTTELLNYEQ